MLITKTFHDVQTQSARGPMRIYVIAPTIPGYPNAKFPGVVVYRYYAPLRPSDPPIDVVDAARSTK